ncbi:hypothetical protein, unknown function [Leishmania tarentolae]|uniref:Uncharacterized protein n=1 Tax=Leishmania tarentolae TaxID=5689 RepID=A0A640KMC4_LEITA|nr:hypothetical protein, unknown function [Leishmania tarentolae]
MPSAYVHEPDMRALVAITRCVAAMQHSEVQSCAALFSDAHDNLVRHSPTSHSRAAGEVEPMCCVSDARQPQRVNHRSSTMRRNGWPNIARRALAFEDSPSRAPLSFSKHAAHRECSAFFTSMKLAEEDIQIEEYVLGGSSDRGASDMRDRGDHDMQSAESRAYWSFGVLQQDNDLIKGGTDARGAYFSSFGAADASRASSHVPPSGTAERTAGQISTSVSQRQRQSPLSPSLWPQSDGAVDTSGLNVHRLRLNINAGIRSKSSRVSDSRHFTLSSTSMTKVKDASSIPRTDSASSVGGWCSTGGFDRAQKLYRRNSSQQALQRQSDFRDKDVSSRSMQWTASEAGEASRASPLENPVDDDSTTSLSPPSVTAAMARDGGSVASYHTEGFGSVVRSASTHSLPKTSRASVESRYSNFISSVERCSTSMRRDGHRYEAERAVKGSSGTKSLSHVAPAVTVTGTAGRYALEAKEHPADRQADVVSATILRATSDRMQRTTRTVFEKPPSVDCAPSSSTASSAPYLEGYTLLVESPPLRSTSALAVTASESSEVAFTSRFLRFSPPSAEAAAVDEARITRTSSSLKSTQKTESTITQYRDVPYTSASSSRASVLTPASMVTADKADECLVEALSTRLDVLSRLEATNGSAARRHYPPRLPLPPPPFESSPTADTQRVSASVQKSFSLHTGHEAERVCNKVEETPLEPRPLTGSPSYSIPSRRRSSLEGAADVPDVARRAAKSSLPAVAGTRDVVEPVQPMTDTETRREPSASAGRLGSGDEILHGRLERHHVAPQPQVIDAADEPPTEVSGIKGDVPREANVLTASDTSRHFSREVSEECQNQEGQQKRQLWHRYLRYVSPVTVPGSSPPSRDGVAAAATHHRQRGVPPSTPLDASTATLLPVLAQRGHCSSFLYGSTDGNASACSLPSDARRGVQGAAGRAGSGCGHGFPASSKYEAEKVDHREAATVALGAPEHSQRTSPSSSHVANTSLGRGEEDRVSYRIHSGSGLRASAVGGEDFDNNNHTNGTTVHRPGRYHGDSDSTTRNRVTADAVTCHTPFDSPHSTRSSFDWVADDYAAQQRRQRYASDGEPFTAVPLSIDTVLTRSPSALAVLAVNERSIRRRCVMDSQTLKTPSRPSGAVRAEDLDRSDPALSVQSADSSTGNFQVLRCTSFNSKTQSPTFQHSLCTPVLGSPLTEGSDIPCMNSLASMERTPPTRSVSSAAALEGSVTECGAPVMSTFFADGHVVAAIPAAAAARKVTMGRHRDVANDAPATQGAALREDEKSKVHAQLHNVESDSDTVPNWSLERSTALGSQHPDKLYSVAQSTVHTSEDAGAREIHTTPSTFTEVRNLVTACSQCIPLESRLHSNSVSRARPTHTCHVASASVSRGKREAYTDSSANLDTGTEGGSSDDGVEDNLDVPPTLGDRCAACPVPAPSIDGGNVYASASSAPKLPPPPREFLQEVQQQVHRERETSLLSISSAGVDNTKDTVTALKAMSITRGTKGYRGEAEEGSRYRVAPGLSSSILSVEATSSPRTSLCFQSVPHLSDRQVEKHESDDVLETCRQRLQQSQLNQDDSVQPQTLHRVLSSDLFDSESCPRWGSVNTQPYDTEGSHSRGDMQDGFEAEPNTMVNTGGGGDKNRGEFASSAPSSRLSSKDSIQANSVIETAMTESRDGLPSSYSSTDAAPPTMPECRAPEPWKRTRLSIPAVLSKSLMESGASRPQFTNELRYSAASPFTGERVAVVSQQAGVYPRRPRAMEAPGDNADSVAGADDLEAEEDGDEDGGYCSYGYEGDLIYV